jgi:hypothetical protein
MYAIAKRVRERFLAHKRWFLHTAVRKVAHMCRKGYFLVPSRLSSAGTGHAQ